jgi:RHS repeat-associated protein
VITLRTFDKLNRVLSESFPASPGENIIYGYDDSKAGNNGVGRLSVYADETGGTTLAYNERGDVTSTTRIIGGQAYTTAYAYDLADHITSITYPSGHIVAYARDTQGRISSAAYRPSLAATSTTLASGVTYMPFGPVSGLLYANGLVRTMIYDKDYRLTGISTLGAGASVQKLGFAYDPASDITSIADNLAGTRSQSFNYDPDYRLTQAVGLYGTTAYTYDAVGNRLTRSVANVTETYNYSPMANLLQSTVKPGATRSFAYTLNGNTSSDNRGTTTNLLFGYGNRNRYNSLSTGATTATYQFNALGERLIKTVGSTTTHYHYDSKHRLIAESQSNGAMIREYVWLDDMPLAQIEANGAVYYIHPDHLNTPQKMTDANQAIVWDNEHQPFGETALPTLTPVGFDTNKQFQMTVNGGPNYIYVVQATASLTTPNWVSLSTNAAPFTFTDSGAQSFQARFYRVIYLPNANVASVTNNLRFPGQYFDAESGLNYNIMRTYDPTVGRYIESDPTGLMGGVNLHIYANNKPLNQIDLLGMVCENYDGSAEQSFYNFWDSTSVERQGYDYFRSAVDWFSKDFNFNYLGEGGDLNIFNNTDLEGVYSDTEEYLGKSKWVSVIDMLGDTLKVTDVAVNLNKFNEDPSTENLVNLGFSIASFSGSKAAQAGTTFFQVLGGGVKIGHDPNYY